MFSLAMICCEVNDTGKTEFPSLSCDIVKKIYLTVMSPKEDCPKSIDV